MPAPQAQLWSTQGASVPKEERNPGENYHYELGTEYGV
jgi:hypothetical protein